MRTHPFAPHALLIDVLNRGSLQGVLSTAYGHQQAPHSSDDDSSISSALASLPSLCMRDEESGDESSISSISTINSEEIDGTEGTTDRFLPSVFISGAGDEEELYHEEDDYDETEALLDDLLEDGPPPSPRARTRAPNRFAYENGDIFKSNYYRQFLCPEKRPRTYVESHNNNKDSRFRSHFRVPLETVDQLTDMFIARE